MDDYLLWNIPPTCIGATELFCWICSSHRSTLFNRKSIVKQGNSILTVRITIRNVFRREQETLVSCQFLNSCPHYVHYLHYVHFQLQTRFTVSLLRTYKPGFHSFSSSTSSIEKKELFDKLCQFCRIPGLHTATTFPESFNGFSFICLIVVIFVLGSFTRRWQPIYRIRMMSEQRSQLKRIQLQV